MLKNYIKIAWRNLYKNKVFSLIHILGLTMGITVCLMIFLYIINEFSVDRFHQQGDNIYRVMRRYDKGKPKVGYLSGPYAPALLNDFPQDIKKAVRVAHHNGLISFGEKAFREKKIFSADSDFFTLFTFPFIRGDARTALTNPGSVVINEKTAQKYFGTTGNAMGKVIQLDKSLGLTVTGIVKNVPPNSHLDFDLVVPISNYAKDPNFNVWINNNMSVYVLLNKHTSKESVEKHFPAFMNKYMGNDMARIGEKFELTLTPLKDVYFERESSFDDVKHGDKTVVFIFISIAVLIMLIACINFMNLSTIRAVERSKEVGMRKVLGALRNHLVWQFIGESVLLAVISCVLSVGLLTLLMPTYNHVLGYDLTVPWNNASIYLFLAGIILVVGFLAGSYPAIFMSAFSPIQALKGKLKLGKGGSLFRQSLVVLQFSISVLLIIGTLVIVKQMQFIKSKSLGYDKEQVVTVNIDNMDIYKNRVQFKNELQNSGLVKSVSLMSGEPGGFYDVLGFEAEGQHEIFKSRTEFADFEYVKTLGLKIIAGRDFSPQFATDSTSSVLINRTAARELGFTPQQAIGKWIRNTLQDDKRKYIIGVIEDFNFLSLKENMDALIIAPNDDRRVIVIKLKPGNLANQLTAIKDVYNRVAPLYPFEYSFLDQQFDTTYKSDIRQQTMLSIFSGLAIFIACLGLFGLASFTAAKRTKEIGVRKVLGSSVQSILVLVSKDLLKPVLLATVLAMPIGYYCMNVWLQSFAYKTPLHWWIFALAALATFLIALFTISFQSLKAALMNPIKSLRTE